MLVKLKTRCAGPMGNFPPGMGIEVEAKQGAALVKGGYAEAVAEAKVSKVEKAIRTAPENATKNRPQPNKPQKSEREQAE